MRTGGRRLAGRAAAALVATLLASPSSAADATIWQRAVEAALQCVPFAREVSGVSIYGDAYTWWDQAEGRYGRGRSPRVGAVMAFTPHGGMRLGHVAVVRRLVNPREVRLDHSNWSPIDGRRGQIERDVRAVDVSPAGDWSQVRVWFGPIAALGGTAWPVVGFIYPTGGDARARIASSEAAERHARDRPVARSGGVEVVAAPRPIPIPSAERPGPVRVAAAGPRRRSDALGRLLVWRAGSARTLWVEETASASGPVRSAAARSAPSTRGAARPIAVARLRSTAAPSGPGRNRSGVAEGPEDLLALVEPTTASR